MDGSLRVILFASNWCVANEQPPGSNPGHYRWLSVVRPAADPFLPGPPPRWQEPCAVFASGRPRHPHGYLFYLAAFFSAATCLLAIGPTFLAPFLYFGGQATFIQRWAPPCTTPRRAPRPRHCTQHGLALRPRPSQITFPVLRRTTRCSWGPSPFPPLTSTHFIARATPWNRPIIGRPHHCQRGPNFSSQFLRRVFLSSLLSSRTASRSHRP